jgi:AcrR family transcriptional regulator
MSASPTVAPRRKRSRRGDGVRLRGEIVHAATALLAEHGELGALTLRAAARRVGIAATSIYLHFPDVESLRAAAIARAFDDFDAARDAAAAGLADPGAVLRARARAYCRFALENPGLYRVMFEVDRPPTERGQASFHTLVNAIERCRDAGSARDDDPTELAVLVWSALHGLASLRINRPQFPWPRSIDDDVERVVTAIVGATP